MNRAGPLFQSKSEYVYEEIKRRVFAGVLGPGAVIGQERLAEELGVSTTPLREALKRLAVEGMVHLGSYRDARVTDLTAEEAQSLYEIRLSVDPLAAALAAERRTTTDTTDIEVALARLQPLSTSAEWESLVAHRNFHRAVYRASHNAPLVGILESLWDKADRYRQASLRNHPEPVQDIERVRAEHQALADAVAASDATEAHSVMQRHVSQSLGRRAIDLLQPGPASPSTTKSP
jgi:DNA-binding GntR family transcriptional regulator